MLPVRVSLLPARVMTRVALRLAGRALDAISSPRQPEPVRYEPEPPRAEGPSQPEAPLPLTAEPPEQPLVDEPVHVTEEPIQAFEEPFHVSEEPELVREEAEPGAEEGAGAEVTVTEPWEGYGRMNAREVIARARSASVAELAAVRLYESGHRSRQTVLTAVDRELKTANGGRMTQERSPRRA